MRRNGGVNINKMKTKIAYAISHLSNKYHNIHPDAIELDVLDNLDDYDNAEFTVHPVDYSIKYPTSIPETTTQIKALCEDDLIHKLPSNLHIARIVRVDVGKFNVYVVKRLGVSMIREPFIDKTAKGRRNKRNKKTKAKPKKRKMFSKKKGKYPSMQRKSRRL
jgi:hypothetical protein